MSFQFHGQRANENVLLVSRQHPIILFHPFLISLLILMIPFVVYVFVPLGLILSIVIAICLIFAVLHGVLAYYAWSRTLLILTNERILFLEQRGLINRQFVECVLTSIQQVSHDVTGLRQTLFGYGTISLYTGDSVASIFIRDIPDPYEIQQEIQRAASGDAPFVDDEDDDVSLDEKPAA